MTTLSALYRKAVAAFEAGGLETPAEDARHLVSGVLGLSLTEMMTEGARVIEPDEEIAVSAAMARRLAREPVYRILGAREFFGLDFMLSADTLEPRPDTEILVEHALAFLKQTVRRKGAVRFVDLGTGTGAIAVALLKNCAGATALATDIADGALETARANALINGVADRFETARGPWLDAARGRYDMIVSNPPYIVSDVIDKLAPEVREHDPALALDGGKDGLDAVRLFGGIGAGRPKNRPALAVNSVHIVDPQHACVLSFALHEMGVAVEDPDDFNSGVDGLNDTGADRAINAWRGTAPNKDSQSTIIR